MANNENDLVLELLIQSVVSESLQVLYRMDTFNYLIYSHNFSHTSNGVLLVCTLALKKRKEFTMQAVFLDGSMRWYKRAAKGEKDK